MRIFIILTLIFFISCSKELIKEKSEEKFVYPNYDSKTTSYFLEGLRNKSKGNWEAALRYFNWAYKESKNLYMKKEIAIANYNLSRFEKSLSAADSAFDKYNNDFELLELMINCSYKLKKDSLFIFNLDQMIDKFPQKYSYYFIKLRYIESNGDLESIVKFINTLNLSSLPPQMANEMLLKKIYSLFQLKRYSEVIKEFKQNIEYIDKENIALNEILVNSHYNIKNYKQAYTYQMKLINLNSLDIEDFYKLILISYNTEDKSKIEESFELSIKKFPQDLDLRVERSKYLFNLGKYTEAENSILSICKSDSLKIIAFNELATIADVKNLKREAIKYYEKALSISKENKNILNNYAYLLSELGENLDLALEYSKKALSKEPNNPSYLDTMGWILYKLKRYEESYNYVKKALDYTDNPISELHKHFAEILLVLDRKSEAVEHFEKAYIIGKDPKILEKIEELK